MREQLENLPTPGDAETLCEHGRPASREPISEDGGVPRDDELCAGLSDSAAGLAAIAAAERVHPVSEEAACAEIYLTEGGGDHGASSDDPRGAERNRRVRVESEQVGPRITDVRLVDEGDGIGDSSVLLPGVRRLGGADGIYVAREPQRSARPGEERG